MQGSPPDQLDYALVGGGLSSVLLALALFHKQPSARVALIEQAPRLGGNHLWCFHAGDVAESDGFVSPLVAQRWPRYDVRFPALARTVEEPYAAVTSARLDDVARRAFAERVTQGCQLLLGDRAVDIGRHEVKLASGKQLRAKVVIESRGPSALPPGDAGYQKFIGLELELQAPSPITHPLLMDAQLPQLDGFRFMYALPFDERRILLEDTYFSDTAELDHATLEARILEYAAEKGLAVARVLRRESGVLPLPTATPKLASATADGPLVAGYQGGWFHPVTGYSFPVAVRLATAVASAAPERLRDQVWPALVRQQSAQLRFGVLLNRLMFGAFAPEERYGAIERFYRLPTESVRRFYALNLTRTDRLRILCGRPPHGFSFPRALGLRALRVAEAT